MKEIRVSTQEGTTSPITLQAAAVEAALSCGVCTVVSVHYYAQHWFEDTFNEAQKSKGDPNARRREILFAVCFAECYLYEWTFKVLQDHYRAYSPQVAILKYYKQGVKHGVKRRWKEVPENLLADTIIAAVPHGGGKHSMEWDALINSRDGFVHSNASRPMVRGVGAGQTPDPQPTPQTLLEMAPGWALRIVVEQVERLHTAAAIAAVPLPTWLRRA
jgi:hypothetical protein